MPISQNGKLAQFGSEKWKAEYGRRVAEILSSFQSNNSKVIWVGLPFPRREDYQGPYREISDTQKAAVSRNSGSFIDIWSSFLVNGQYSSFGLDASNKKALIRADDGIHFTEAGYIKVADLLSSKIGKLLSEKSLRCQQ